MERKDNFLHSLLTELITERKCIVSSDFLSACQLANCNCARMQLFMI